MQLHIRHHLLCHILFFSISLNDINLLTISSIGMLYLAVRFRPPEYCVSPQSHYIYCPNPLFLRKLTSLFHSIISCPWFSKWLISPTRFSIFFCPFFNLFLCLSVKSSHFPLQPVLMSCHNDELICNNCRQLIINLSYKCSFLFCFLLSGKAQ